MGIFSYNSGSSFTGGLNSCYFYCINHCVQILKWVVRVANCHCLLSVSMSWHLLIRKRLVLLESLGCFLSYPSGKVLWSTMHTTIVHSDKVVTPQRESCSHWFMETWMGGSLKDISRSLIWCSNTAIYWPVIIGQYTLDIVHSLMSKFHLLPQTMFLSFYVL